MTESHSLRNCFRSVRTEKQYLKIILANIINRFGDSIDAVAFGWLVYQLTGSKEWLAVIMGVNLLPTVLFQPFAGAWVNYLNRKKVMVLCDWGRGILVLLIAVLFLSGRLTPGILLAITLFNSSLEALRVPCSISLLPKILKPENMKPAMSFNTAVSRASELIGMGLSGLIIAWVGIGGAVLIDAVTFLGSGLVLCFLKIPNDTERASGGYFKELRGGFSYLRGNHVIILVIVLCFILNMVEGPMLNLRAAYIDEGLHLAEDALSAGSLLLSIGMLLGSLLYPILFGRFTPRRVFMVSGIAIGAAYLALAAITPIPAAIQKIVLYSIISLFYGITSTTLDMALQVVMVQNVDGKYMGRIAGIFNSLACASAPVAAALTALVIGFTPMVTFYIAVGILTVVVFIILTSLKSMKMLK